MKFKLVCEYEEGDVITHEFNKVLLSDVLMRMQDFLKGCGFVFDGTLDIVSDEEMYPQIDSGEFDEKKFRNELQNDLNNLSKEYRNSDVDQDGRC
jgi:hypothetical protein